MDYGAFQGTIAIQWVLTPKPFEDPYSYMIPDEKSKMIMALMAAREPDAERTRRDEDDFDGTP